MSDLVMRKRRARAGEIGFFIDAEIFEEDFNSVKMDTDLKVEVTYPKSPKQLRFFWALAGKVAENCEWITDKDNAAELILIHARHVRYVHDKLRGKTEIRAKSISKLNGDEFLRLLKRCIYIVETEFLPGMPEGALKSEIEAMIAPTGDFR